MRFLPDGPDIPAELLATQEKGQTIFVCGAGVSYTVGLPLFRGLVEGVYRELGEDWTLHPAENEGMQNAGKMAGQYDRVLRCLERRLAASDAPRNRGMRERIRAAIHKVLAPPDNIDLTNHLALLGLSRDAEGRERLVTTNFDTLFERAWFDQHGTGIASHAGPAMPQPRAAGCIGVLHLHGRLADPRLDLGLSETDLVLTSAEFGDAYLRLGWASRYVYDLVRGDTLVLVGYQADDPPMRYLLEALEADRERYPDLQKVYAFASCAGGDEKIVSALWRAKGVEPILYAAHNGDHSSLYHSLREWRRYADDPTAWRRGQLSVLLNKSPGSLENAKIRECAALLGHGDASQLLGELSPKAEWLPVLVQNRVFNSESTQLGEWIATRVNDPEMIRACAGLPFFHESTRWHIGRALGREKSSLAPIRLKAWKLMLRAKRRQPTEDPADRWYPMAPNIIKGDAGFEARRLIGNILRPRLEVKSAFHFELETGTPNEPETLGQLVYLTFDSARDPPPEKILAAWPETAGQEIALFRSLHRALIEALEEAEDVGFFDGFDRTSYDVPSVAPHPQNAYRTGFYPITRALADLWVRIAARDRKRARELVLAWKDSQYLLAMRLWLFTLAHDLFTPTEAAAAIVGLGDHVFWVSGAQTEIMRLLTERWMEFDPADRLAIETRLRTGIPRELFPPEAFDNEDDWISVRDSSVFKRLKRIEATNHTLSAESHARLAEIAARHPSWQPGAGDRDDFLTWTESGSGPSGHPELLAEIADDRLVEEAMRLQRERRFEESDIWRTFCSADPYRALRGLRLEANNRQWDPEAWQYLLWAAIDNDQPEFQFALADSIEQIPDQPLQQLLLPVTSWIQRRRDVLSATDHRSGPRFLPLWDRLADLAFGEQGRADSDVQNKDDLLTQSFNSPGGNLAWALLDALYALKPKVGSTLGPELVTRFDKIASAGGRPGLLARVVLTRAIANLDSLDPVWTEEKLGPRFSWEHPEALAMWRSYSSQSEVGSARLFNAFKPAMLAAFERRDLSDHEFEGLVSKLLSIGIWHQRGQALEYALTSSEIKRALTVGPRATRQNASWNFWRMMGDNEGDPADRASRWRHIIGPVFQNIWPLDGALRSAETSHNLVLMALECEAAFPEAVESILDLVVPYRLDQLSWSVRLEDKHSSLVREHPVAFVRLVNAIIDPAIYPVPNDLATFLQDCLDANPAVANDRAYTRLYGLRRRLNA